MHSRQVEEAAASPLSASAPQAVLYAQKVLYPQNHNCSIRKKIALSAKIKGFSPPAAFFYRMQARAGIVFYYL